MAETDLKSLSEIELYNDKLNANSMVAFTVKPSGSNVTRRIYYNALRTQIVGYDLVGTLTSGSTSITLNSNGSDYDATRSYAVNERVIEDSKHYICVAACSSGQWNENKKCFVEYTLLGSNSTVDIYTKTGDAPYIPATITSCSVSNNSITLTFASSASDRTVKVRVR